MPDFIEHCAETTAALGLPFEEVRERWGEPVAAAERLHVIADLKQEGWTEDQPFPRDERHYKAMGLF